MIAILHTDIVIHLDERLKVHRDNSSIGADDSTNTIGMPIAPAKDWSIVGTSMWLF